MSIPICQMCKDPIWSFICPQCIGKEIRRWLPDRVRSAFSRFDRDLLDNFSTSIDMDGLRCLRCRKVRLASICPFCYLAEVYDWLKDVKPALAESFLRFIPLRSVLRQGSHGMKWNDGIVPIGHTEMPELDEGICESCDRYTDELIHLDGRWICRDCESLEA